MSTNLRDAFTDAVEELASANAARRVPENITDADALKHVDHDVVCAWAMGELGRRSPQGLLSDCIENLTDADVTSVLTCVLNETDTARKILARCVTEYVAHELALEAQKLADKYRSGDTGSPRTSYAAWVDDPIIGDQRAIARNSRNV